MRKRAWFLEAFAAASRWEFERNEKEYEEKQRKVVDQYLAETSELKQLREVLWTRGIFHDD